MVDRLASCWKQSRPAVMGILNVTPDSFSDGGRFPSAAEATAQGLALLASGADLIDIGGESTRPGATSVPEDEEQARVLPVLREVLRQSPRALVSVDTSKTTVAAAALAAGAALINDVSAGSEPGMLDAIAHAGAGIVLMHMRGEPRTMQHDTTYSDVVAEVHEYLAGRATAALRAGVARERVFLDPGIGFGKDVEGNLALLAALPDLATLGFAIVLGASRKSFIGTLTGASVGERLPGSLAAVARAVTVPRAVVRVHDVAATRQFLTVLAAIGKAA